MKSIEFDFVGSLSGETHVQWPLEDVKVPPLSMVQPIPLPTPTDSIQNLVDKFLNLHVPNEALDVSKSGYSWSSQYINPSLWTSPSQPTTTIEPILPPSYLIYDDASDDNDDDITAHTWNTDVGYYEERLDLLGDHDDDATTMNRSPFLASNHHKRIQISQQATRDFVRGKSGSMPFMPGGEAWAAAGNAAAAAAIEEAKTGRWLAELESENISKIHGPGMSRGAFGPWSSQSMERDDGAEDGAGNLAKNSAPPIKGDGDHTVEEDHATYKQAILDQDGRGLQQGVHAVNEDKAKKEAPSPLEDLFEGVWMFEEEEEKKEEESILSHGSEEEKIAGAGAVSTTTATTVASNTATTPAGADVVASISTMIDALFDPRATTRHAQTPLLQSQPQNLFDAQNLPEAKASQKDTWAIKAMIPNLEYRWSKLKPAMAKMYPFELDTFQKEAILLMEQGQSVFVAAHTSAGKTVAAEYAFALATRHCTRAVYTSPIKTISNQKFRDFSGEFEVGLLTGDVSIKPESSCLIMTTEILRSMLYKGADIIRDIEWIIFDEVHYVNDAERGVVWEEVIIMLPDHINLLLLSATVPNVMEFADWVGRTKRKAVYVTGTMRRPVPLEHSLYYAGQLFTVCSHERYDQLGFKKARDTYDKKNAVPQTKSEAKAALPTGRGGFGRGDGGGRGPQQQQQQRKTGGGTGSGSNSKFVATRMAALTNQSSSSASAQLRGERSQWGQLIDLLKKRDLLPMVVFCFSKKRCDTMADLLNSLDLTTSKEKSEIHVFCDASFARLKGSDRQLPQVLRLREMLKRGLGVHHAGLLPIVKEVVEMLFCRGVIKVLFSTETFAMGVNAPARTVVFQSLRKHDGKQFRFLLPGEYTQMAGRAGRRGLDSVGTVIIACWEDIPDEAVVRRLLTGAATKLESQFRLTYSMILNLLRVEDLKVEDMLKRSFAEFHAQKAQPGMVETLQKGQEALRRLRHRPWPLSPQGTTREEVEEYAKASIAVEDLSKRLQEAIMSTRGAASALSNGRVVLVQHGVTGVMELGAVLEGRNSGGGGGGGGRTKTVLCLRRSSPLECDKAAAPLAADNVMESNPVGDKIEEQSSGGIMKVLKKCREDDDDDDDDLMMMGMAKKKKGGGGKGSSRKMMPASVARATPMPLPCKDAIAGTMYCIAQVALHDIVGISKTKIRADADDILIGDKGSIAAVVNALSELHHGQQQGALLVELMDPISDLKLTNFELAASMRERQVLLTRVASMPAHKDPFLPEMMAIVRSEQLLARRLAAVAQKSGDASLSQLPEFHVRVGILQQLGYLDKHSAVTMKGRVACEINSGDELVATEMIFGGVLTDVSPEEAAALLSALVFQEKTEIEPMLTPKLAEIREKAADIALSAGILQKEAGLDVLPEEFLVSTLKFGLMEAVYRWALGVPFSDICTLTDVMEGSIVRTIVRLDETCREFRDAARVMGNTALFELMEAASAAIKRDVCFSASLYVA